jgi:valyl-tRNA synthetase
VKKQLEKTYSPQLEQAIYDRWLERKYFHAEVDESRKPYTIMMPPANITGKLHVGHSLTFSIQDELIRYKRMQGYNTLWLPGTDHASIATEVKIVNSMAEEGLTKRDVGREGFLKRAWKWRDEYGGAIDEQLKKMGLSCDWDRESFTMDEGLSKAVLATFIHLYEKGWIYRGEKLINWCPKCHTTISDAEVEHEDMEGTLFYFKYPIDGGGFLEFATTRPETILGDTAIAVNPTDERYTELVGKMVTVPIVGRQIPIIADEYVDKTFGTGVVKITPAHDPNDYEVGERHNLPRINVLNDDGTMNANAGAYQGQTREECRKNITEDFKKLGLFIKTEKIVHAVGTHDRCHTVMEPMIKLQWFVKMADLAKPALDAYTNGQLHIYPANAGKVYTHWLENIRDWCISRQLWWGHRIPAYYCQKCGHMHVSMEKPERCEECGCTDLEQDEDTLDTWFSSALWPFSTLGWPEHTPELKYFYPTDVLVTGREILFFWVIRMMFSGIELMGEPPFKDVMLHGIVRDDQGRKMSKSLNNGVDPLQVVEQYGADALRLMLVTGNALENDTRFYWSRLETCRNFLNKLWNAARFTLMNLDGGEDDPEAPNNITVMDKWILSRANTVSRDVTARMDSYDLGMAAQMAYDFVWDEFCDWYIEMVKPRLYNEEDPTRKAALWTLKQVLSTGLKLLHPFVPFITEEIYTTLHDEADTIMFAEWPKFDEARDFKAEEKAVGRMQEAVKGIRAARLEMKVPASKKVTVVLVSADSGVRDFFRGASKTFGILAGAKEVKIQPDKTGVDENAVHVVVSDASVYIPLDEMVDREKERERLKREQKRLTGEVARAQGKLSNEGFMRKAPATLIAEEQEKLANYKDMLAKVESQLNAQQY